jgi:hypothetical protein
MLPRSANDLLQFGAQFARAIESHRHDLPLGEVASNLYPMLEQLRNRIDDLVSANSTRQMSTQRLVLSNKALEDWLAKARLVITLARAARPDASAQSGFADRTFRIPRRLSDRIAVARSLVSFFARRPEFGVAFAEVTAAKGRALYERVVQSGEMLQLAKSDCELIRQQQTAIATEMRQILRRAVSLLKTQLNGSDVRRTDFGLIPSQVRRRNTRGSAKHRRRASHFVPNLERVEPAVAA